MALNWESDYNDRLIKKEEIIDNMKILAKSYTNCQTNNVD
jgi:hypothetical protein